MCKSPVRRSSQSTVPSWTAHYECNVPEKCKWGLRREQETERSKRERERQREARVNEDGRRPSSGLRVAGGVESRNLLR